MKEKGSSLVIKIGAVWLFGFQPWSPCRVQKLVISVLQFNILRQLRNCLRRACRRRSAHTLCSPNTNRSGASTPILCGCSHRMLHVVLSERLRHAQRWRCDGSTQSTGSWRGGSRTSGPVERCGLVECWRLVNG